MDKPDKIDKLIKTWRAIIIGDQKSWVLFENGTCVILMEPQKDLEKQATELIKKCGPVHVGTESADFAVIKLDKDPYPGWVVTGHHSDILNYVSPDEFKDDNPSDVAIGLLGRFYREEDGKSQKIVHIEDKR